MSATLLLGALTTIPSGFLLIKAGNWPVVALDVAALSWLGVLWAWRGMAYRTRVMQFVAIVLLTGCGLMMTVGSSSQLYMVAAPVLAALLLGARSALTVLLIGALAIFGMCYSGIGVVYLGSLPRRGLAHAVVITLNFAFVAAIITLSCSFLLQRLARSLDQLKATAASLREGEEALRAANAELSLTAAAVARLSEMVVIARIDERPGSDQPIIFVNDAFERRTGYSRAEVLGGSWRILLGPKSDAAEVARLALAIDRGEAITSELRYHAKDGDSHWIEFELKPFADAGGVKTHWVGIARDITERRKAESHIHKLAFYDVLTGLPNRRLLMERLEALLADADVADAAACRGIGALMFIDLDHFKVVNDARGHAIGDALLTRAASRLGGLVGEHDTVARLGGDEFVVLLGRLGHHAEGATTRALHCAESIRHALAESFVIDGRAYQSSASIGVTMVGTAARAEAQREGGRGAPATVQDLLREADTAMYQAKAGGRNRVALFEPRMHADMEQRLTLASHQDKSVLPLQVDPAQGLAAST